MSKQIDLDDLPPKVAALLAGLQVGEELILVQHGGIVSRLAVAEQAAPEPSDALEDLPPNERMEEILSQFQSAIHDEF